jgi:hypothetical protein
MGKDFKDTFLIMRRAFVVIIFSLVLIGVQLLPALSTSIASAATITQRSLSIGSGIISASTSYTFSFVPGTTDPIQGLEFQACTTALGTCTAPAGLSFSSAAGGSLTGSWTNATAFTVDATGANNCIASASVLCAKRTQASNESGASQRGVLFTGITNPNGTSCATSNCTFFVRMTTYSATTYTAGSIVDTGNVASSTIQTLTINASVQEALSFCVGATAINDATTGVATCSSITGSSLNLGVLNSSDVNVSPVSTTFGGDANNGLVELSTNASNGASVDYNAVTQSGTNHTAALRVAGSTCTSGATNTDQCINSIASPTVVTAGAEAFGMTIAGVNCSNTSAYYSCSFAGGTEHLDPTANYDCTGSTGNTSYPSNTTDTSQVAGPTGCKYVWDESGTQDTIASSTTVVGSEALILKFAATANLVTPTGTYTAVADFVAIPSF